MKKMVTFTALGLIIGVIFGLILFSTFYKEEENSSDFFDTETNQTSQKKENSPQQSSSNFVDKIEGNSDLHKEQNVILDTCSRFVSVYFTNLLSWANFSKCANNCSN